MKTRVTTQMGDDALEVIINNFNRRREGRVDLLVPLFVRRPSNTSQYRKEVPTENVSVRGARIIIDVKLELGTELLINAFEDFSALAVVRHCTKRPDGNWSVGLAFIKKSGHWIVVE